MFIFNKQINNDCLSLALIRGHSILILISIYFICDGNYDQLDFVEIEQ